MSKKQYYTISTVNPETGKGDDLIATARAAVTHLHSLCEQDKSGRYFGRFPIQRTLEDAGFTTGVSHFILFLNFMGLVRKLKKDGSKKGEALYQYLVVDPSFFDLLVTQDSVCSVLKHMHERLELQKTCTAQQKQLEKLEASLPASSVNEADISKVNENLAEVIAEVERLRQENTSKDELIAEKENTIAALKEELQESPKVDPKTVSEELMARFRTLKST